MFFDISKIVDHIHSVTLFIFFSEVNYELAGKLVALIAKLNFVIQNFFTFFLNKRALFISWAATTAVRQFDSSCFSIVFISKIAAAHVTVHATWCNQLRFHIIKP